MAYLMNIRTFEQITKQDILLVGGKGASLGIMNNAGIPIPPGFIVTTDVYKNFFNQSISIDVQNEILQAFDNLGVERVAVRSSAVAEDSTTASWAGQLETYLNVTKDKLIESIKKCWVSTHSARAKAYAQKQGLAGNQEIAVVVQKMINSEISGVMFTVNPVTKNKDEIMLEAIYGLGELLVQGQVTPYNYILDKNTLEVKSNIKGEQETMLVYQNGDNKEMPLPTGLQIIEILKIDDLKQLSKLALQIENIYKHPQDIEWAKEKGRFFIVQARPITTI